MSGLNVLLATNRPAIRAILAELGRAPEGGFALSSIPLGVDATAGRRQELAAAAVAVIDVGSNPPLAVSVCNELHGARPELPIVALVCCPHMVSYWHVQALVSACVSSILDLHASEDEIRRSLQSAAAGNVVLRVDLGHDGQTLLDGLAGGSGLAGHRTSETDLRIIQLVADGLSDRDIAGQLHLSPHTVSHHVARLSDRVGARNRTALAAWAGSHGFHQPQRQAQAQSSLRRTA
jgi:DNA-binding NarL/FixJ family response regulator